MASATRKTGRRVEYAELTRQAILDAAWSHFTEQGYFATTVDKIATEARVAPATVYAVGGGKSGLLRTLIEAATTSDENADIRARIEAIADPHELIRYVVAVNHAKFRDWSGLMRQVVAAAPQEPGVRESMEIAHESMRRAFRLTAGRLDAMNALREGVDAARAADLLWIYLCNAANFVRTDDLGWSLDESEAWLNSALPGALF